MDATNEGNKELVEILLSGGADVNLEGYVCDIDDCYDEYYFLFLYFVRWFCFKFYVLFFVFFLNSMETLPSWTLLRMATKRWLKYYCLLEQM